LLNLYKYKIVKDYMFNLVKLCRERPEEILKDYYFTDKALVEEFDATVFYMISFYTAEIRSVFSQGGGDKKVELIASHMAGKDIYEARGHSSLSALMLKEGKEKDDILSYLDKSIGYLNRVTDMAKAFSGEASILGYAELLLKTDDEKRQLLGVEIKTNAEFRANLNRAMGLYLDFITTQRKRLDEIMNVLKSDTETSTKAIGNLSRDYTGSCL
jgi:hypothetical protein